MLGAWAALIAAAPAALCEASLGTTAPQKPLLVCESGVFRNVKNYSSRAYWHYKVSPSVVDTHLSEQWVFKPLFPFSFTFFGRKTIQD